MKRYAPCIPEEAVPGSMSERADGEYYLAADADAELATMNLAVGYFHEENDRFITRIAELEKSHQRYEKLRRLSPREFHSLWMQTMGGDRFDDVVDRLPF